VRFAVTDTGIGIDAQHLPHIFEPFHQVDDGMSRRYGGVGIGLTRSRQIARALGGDIRCSSEPGHGSSFSFEFPVPEISGGEAEPPEGERGEAADALSRQGHLAGVRVLLAEDNPINALVIVDQLERLGAAVQSVADGQAAVQAACVSPAPDLVLMDCQMPELDGFEAARRIRAYEREQGRAPVPILAVTALAGDADHAACLAAGMNGRLVKPVSMRALERELRKFMRPSCPDAQGRGDA
jgi:CheY-like chemotaxis protein